MRSPALFAIAAALASFDATSRPADAGPDPVVVRVGSSEVRASELGHYFGRLHPFERESFGSTPTALRRGYVERRLVPELLLAEQARSLGLTSQPEVVTRIDKLLVEALEARIQREIDKKLTSDEVRDYCRRGGGKTDAECQRDVWSYRIALRRTKTHTELAARTKALEARFVHGLDVRLLDRLSVSARGVTSAPPPPAERR